MSTRRAEAGEPISQERYMSSPEFSNLQCINGHAVAKRCALLVSPEKKELLWFLQGLSLQPGALRQLANELVEMYPDRIGTPAMRRIGSNASRPYSKEQTAEVLSEIDPSGLLAQCLGLENRTDFLRMINGSHEPSRKEEMQRGLNAEQLRGICKGIALGEKQLPDGEEIPVSLISLEDFFIELCINPRLEIVLDGSSPRTDRREAALARDAISGSNAEDFSEAGLSYFQGILDALLQYKRHYEDKVKADYCQTAISRQIWSNLDQALQTGSMILVDGLEGRGKTQAVKAWCRCHLGVSRFVSLDGTSTKTTQFREMAKALGVGHGYAQKVSQMQFAVKDVLQLSGLLMVIDEAHFFFNQTPRMHTRPEMLDWIDTALCNPPLPVALITTPQFIKCMERAAGQVGWNYRQFRRRCKRYIQLPPRNTAEDIERVARHLLPGADAATIKQIVAYEALSKRDLSAVGDVVREAKLIAEQDGSSKVVFSHVKRAIHEVLMVSDIPWAELDKRLQNKRPGRNSVGRIAASLSEPEQPISEPSRENLPADSQYGGGIQIGGRSGAGSALVDLNRREAGLTHFERPRLVESQA
jgi:hypothetical protein